MWLCDLITSYSSEYQDLRCVHVKDISCTSRGDPVFLRAKFMKTCTYNSMTLGPRAVVATATMHPRSSLSVVRYPWAFIALPAQDPKGNLRRLRVSRF